MRSNLMRNLFFAILFLALTGPAFAGSCLKKISLIDQALKSSSLPNAAEVKELRDQGEELHKAGDHSRSVMVLKKAMKLANLSD